MSKELIVHMAQSKDKSKLHVGSDRDSKAKLQLYSTDFYKALTLMKLETLCHISKYTSINMMQYAIMPQTTEQTLRSMHLLAGPRACV